jgi:hypothetical protein
MLDLSIDNYFEEKINSYFNKNNLHLNPFAKSYLISLLKKFISTDEIRYRTLFEIYQKCIEDQKISNFQYLGDHSLYIAGLFPHSLSRSLVGVNYYIQMGQLGYLHAANMSANTSTQSLYKTMASNFKTYMNSLYSIGNDSLLKDKMALYSQYLITENPEMLKELIKSGVYPTKN